MMWKISLVLVALSMLFISCTETYNITTPEMFDEAITSVNSDIIGSGYTLVSLREDTVKYNTFFYRDYLFLSPTDSVHYSVTFQRNARQVDAFVPYIDTVLVTCNGSQAGCEIANRLSVPPTKKSVVLTDGAYTAMVIGPPILTLLGFMIWAAVINVQQN